MSDQPVPVLVTLLAPEFRADPFPVYAGLREESPVLDTGNGLWILTRYEDCRAALRDPRVSSDPHTAADYEAGLELAGRAGSPVQDLIEQLMLFRDAPDHTRLRGLVQKAFTPRRVADLRPRVVAVVEELLDAVAPRGEMEVIADFGFPLPIIVIAEMLGVPAEDRDRFGGWARDLALTFEPFLPPDVRERAERASHEFGAYLAEQIELRRAEPRDDLLTALVEAESEGDRLTQVELVTNVILLLIAGHETTQNLIGNGLLALLRHPDQLALLREADDPELPAKAVEELLRFDGPVQLTARYAREDLEIGGHRIPRGGRLLLLLGAANRDPAQFPDPDRLDLARGDRSHLGLGGGPHFCLGNALARLEVEEALPRLVRRLPDLALAGDGPPAQRDTITLRGLTALPVTFTAAV